MTNPTLENWFISYNGFSPNGEAQFLLIGEVYNHPSFENGTSIITSTLQSLSIDESVAKTRNTVYNLGFCIDDTYVDLFEENK